MNHSRDLTPLREVLAGLGGLIGLERPLESAELWRRWPEIAGEALAAHAEPSGLKDGVLRVWADSSVWATEIGYMAPRLSATINATLGSDVVRELQVFTGPAPVRTGRERRRRPVSWQPRDPSKGASTEDPIKLLQRAREAWSRARDRGRRGPSSGA